MTFLYVLTVLAIGLAAAAVLAAVTVVFANAMRRYVRLRREAVRMRLIKSIVLQLDRGHWDQDLVALLTKRKNLAADLLSELSELIKGSDRDRLEHLFALTGIDIWVRRQVRSFSRNRRKAAVEILKIVPGEDSVRVLLSALDDRSPEVRLTAAVSLAHLKALPSMDDLLRKVIYRDKRQSLLLSHLFESIAATRPMEVLNVAGRSEEDGLLRAVAIRALGRSGRAEAADRIVDFIEDKDPEVRAASLEASAGLGYFAPEASLRTALSDPVFFVQVAALEYVRRMEQRSLITDVKLLLGSPNWWVRFHAQETLQVLGHRAISRNQISAPARIAERGAA